VTDPHWRDRARCKLYDARLFDEPDNEPGVKARIAAAQAVCARCPVVAPCLKDARDNHLSGVWGGVLLVDGHAAPRRGRPPATLHVDPIAVEKATHGERVPLNKAERHAAIRELYQRGLTAPHIASRLGGRTDAIARWIERGRKRQQPYKYDVPPPCGTVAAAKRHTRNGEKRCDPCRLAANAARRHYRDRGKGPAA
jgi:WhiB family transcriptional regulator, redox-sensing transcriptional regulator